MISTFSMSYCAFLLPAVLSLVLLSASPIARLWSTNGHMLTCQISRGLLEPAAAHAVKNVLLEEAGNDISMLYTWPDQLTDQFSSSLPLLHYSPPVVRRHMNVLLLLMAGVKRSLSHLGTLIPHESVALGLYFGVKPSRAQPTEKVHVEERYRHDEVKELLEACIDCRWLRSAAPIPLIAGDWIACQTLHIISQPRSLMQIILMNTTGRRKNSAMCTALLKDGSLLPDQRQQLDYESKIIVLHGSGAFT